MMKSLRRQATDLSEMLQDGERPVEHFELSDGKQPVEHSELPEDKRSAKAQAAEDRAAGEHSDAAYDMDRP
jgi:hypothetical protein